MMRSNQRPWPVGRQLLAPLMFGGLLLAAIPAVWAQTPVFQPLLTGHRIDCAQYAGGYVYAGLRTGGLAEWDPATGEARRILTRRDGLGGHYVRDLAWVGGILWVATWDGGLTAITAPGTAQESLQVYSGLLSSLKVTAVAGQVVGDGDRIYYGTEDSGIGVINSGLAGTYYSTLDGLIDDAIDCLALADDLLLVATPSGLSRFADNIFTNYPYADANAERIRDLQVGPDGAIWAATNSGVKLWNDAARAWDSVFGTAIFRSLAVDGQRVWALSAFETVFVIQGGSAQSRSLPPVPAGEIAESWAIAAGGGQAWAAGLIRVSGMSDAGSLVSRAMLAPIGEAGAGYHELDTCQLGVAGGFDGVAIDSRGRAWLGDREGDGLGGYADGLWYNVTQRGTAENDFQGLYNWGGGLLAMARDGDDIWFNQFVTGVIRFRPAAAPGGAEVWERIHRGNSAMLGYLFVQIAVHPDGPVFFCTDPGDADLGVDVLVEPDNWQDPASWLHLYPSQLGGNNIWAVGFERRDVVWFGVRGSGLQRWDVNGPLAGPDDPLTWTDLSDDQWLATPLENVPGSQLDLKAANAIVAGPDGTLFAGGAGVVNFRYDPFLQRAILLSQWEAKNDAFGTGLLAQSVTGLSFDRNGDLWALTSGGLNRMRLSAQPLVIDAYTDLETFVNLDPSLYSPGVIAPLPGGTYRRLDMSADGTRLVLSSDLGGALVEIPAAGSDVGVSLDTVYLYPNPLPGPSGDTLLNLGGLNLAPGQSVTIEVFNLAGQTVHRLAGATSLTGVWDGRNRQGRRAAAGLYLVKISFAGRSAIKPLAVGY